MKTGELSDTTTLAEHEFDIPCQATKLPCELPSRWALWLSHAQRGCNATLTVCDLHKMQLHELWRVAMRSVPAKCQRCGQLVSRNLDDNIKWTAL